MLAPLLHHALLPAQHVLFPCALQAWEQDDVRLQIQIAAVLGLMSMEDPVHLFAQMPAIPNAVFP
jgi:hypothetical protein